MSVANSKSIQKAIAGKGRSFQYYQDSPRMIPMGLQPACHQMHITVDKEKFTAKKKGKKGGPASSSSSSKTAGGTSVLAMLRKSKSALCKNTYFVSPRTT